MSSWRQRIRQSYKDSTLREPKSKIAKVRAALPEIEAILAAGYSQSECLEFLKRNGLVIDSIGSFRVMLLKARQLGPLVEADALQMESVGEPKKPTKYSSQTEPKSVELVSKARESIERVEKQAGSGKVIVERVDGVIRSSAEKKRVVLNTTPKLEDFM